MRKLIFLLSMFVTPLLFGLTVKSAKIAASGGSPVPTSYSATDSQSLVLTGLAGKTHLLVLNDTSDKIAMNVDAQPSVIAPGNTRDIYVNASGSASWDNISLGDRIYLRSDSGVAITAGTIYIMTW